MVCVYCSNKTKVVNSRQQKRGGGVWRRRTCANCKSIFTSIEEFDKKAALRVFYKGRLLPYDQDKLFISIYESCRHRPSAIEDARALTETIFYRLMPLTSKGVIRIEDLKNTALKVLKNFDNAALVHYQAYYL